MLTSKKEFPFKLGADPEFSIMLKDNRIPADRILNILFKDLESTGSGFKIKKAGEIGWDGHSLTGEIRPAPANTPRQLVENIRQLFTAMNEKSKGLKRKDRKS